VGGVRLKELLVRDIRKRRHMAWPILFWDED
jgi:hypothetical protein